MTRRSTGYAIGLAAAAALGGGSAAQASHWPQTGGHDGHSSYQAADPAQLPLPFRWLQGEYTFPQTSPIVTAGASLSEQSVFYGFMDDNPISDPSGPAFVVARDFGSGAERDRWDIDDDTPMEDPTDSGTVDADFFGPTGGITPVEASGHGSPGNTYLFYNDDNATAVTNCSATPYHEEAYTIPCDANSGGNDISMAQFDSLTGRLVQDQSVGGQIPMVNNTFDGMTITSSPVMGPEQGDGSRLVFFLVQNSDGTAKHIAEVSIANAAVRGTFPADAGDIPGAPSTAESRTGRHAVSVAGLSPNIPDLNVQAAPTLVRVREPDSGSRVLHVAVATTDGIRTFRASNLADAGPAVAGLGMTWTPSIPTRSDGSAPTGAPIIYAASQSGESTVVRRFVQEESDVLNPEKLKVLIPAGAHAQSPELSGKPAHSLAVTQEIPTSGPAAGIAQPGRVIVATSTNVFSLDTEDLAAEPAQVFAADREVGFETTAPSASHGLGFISDKKGQQFVFFTDPADAIDGQLRVQPDETGFQPDQHALNSTSSTAQPAISRGRVVFGADNGFFVYGSNVAITKPAANAAVKGNTVPLEAYVYDQTLTSATFFVDEQPVGTDTVNDDRTFSVVWNSLAGILDGTHTVRAEATDGVTTETSAARAFVVNNYLNPTAALTVSPKTVNPGQPVTLDATGSQPTPTEADETIVRWAFELDGDNDFDDLVETPSSETPGRITRTFEPGTRVVGVRVTDSHGDAAQKTDTVRVNTPPAANLAVGPNPAAEGQEVTADASGSSDADGSIVKYEFDLDGNGTFELDNGANAKVQRVFAAGVTTVSARVTDNEGAPSEVAVKLTVNAKPANQIPIATFRVTPGTAKVDQRVLFDATGARDPDGSIARYEWDLDGNGTFETNSQSNPRVQRSYATAKVYNVKLRVTDNLGALSAEFKAQLVVGATQRKSPRRLSARVTPGRDATLPYDFRTNGKLTRPSGVSAKSGCTGRVTVTVKAGTKTISRRTTRLRSNCTYRTSVRFRDRTRIGTLRALRFTARFQGNKALRARQATTVRVRVA